jgi:hypothetical protein
MAAFASFLHEEHEDSMVFNSNSFPIAVDNCALRCMTCDARDFINDPVPIKVDMLGIGKSAAVKYGTIRWIIENNDGIPHLELIPDTYYVPNLPVRLLAPQHWAQTNPDREAHCDTNAKQVVLECSEYKRTVLLNRSNIAVLRSASGFHHARSVINSLHSVLSPQEPCCFPAHLIPTDEELDEQEAPSNDMQHTEQVTTVFEGAR